MAVEQHSVLWPERYRVARTACSHWLGKELANSAASIRNPVVKLRFLRDVIDHQRHLPRTFKFMVLRPLRRAVLRVHSFLTDGSHATHQSLTALTTRIAIAGLSCFAIVMSAYSIGTQTNNPRATPSQVIALAPPPSAPPPGTSIDLPAPLAPVAESLPADAQGLAPTTIWRADHGSNWELYSNGLRIETTYTVAGEPRRYRIHAREQGLQPTVHTKPVGILFHISESDLWPLDAGFNKQLRKSSTALLKYVKEQRAYNYVIDRFGRVYRIVDDETRANHAGNSVWANGEDVYLDLNSSFLGISFESRWEQGRALPITRAQLVAGRNLTNYLRQRFAIAPEMCATHGLTSVSPRQHLIGYHTDWARGFPFTDFGLPDQYALPPASIALFGFGYDDDLKQRVGEGWPGLDLADTVLANQAQDSGVSIETLRAQRRSLYTQWAKEVRITTSDTATEQTIAPSTAIETATSKLMTEPRG